MLATCMQHMKRFNEYAALAQQMVAIAVTPQERLWSIDCLAKSGFELKHDDESIKLMREGRLLARELGDAVLETNLAEWEALGLSFKGRQQEAREVGKTLPAFIQANPQDETIALRKRQYAYLLEMDNQFEQAIELLHDAAERARTDGDLGLVSEIQVIRGACLYNLGQPDAAIDEYHAARRLQIENAGGTAGWTTYDVMLGRYLQEAGRYREAHQVLASALESHGPGVDWFHAQCTATLAHCFITLGQAARAQRLLGSAPPADAVARAIWLHAKVRLARADGKATRALLDQLAEQAGISPRAERLLWQARIELARELDAAESVVLADQVAEQSLAKKTYSAYLPAKAVLVDALRRAGRHADRLARRANWSKILQRMQRSVCIRPSTGGSSSRRSMRPVIGGGACCPRSRRRLDSNHWPSSRRGRVQRQLSRSEPGQSLCADDREPIAAVKETEKRAPSFVPPRDSTPHESRR